MSNPNSKSNNVRVRFLQANILADEVVKTLPTPTHGLIAFICWRHANENGIFQLSASRIAHDAKLGERQAKRVLRDLVSMGLLVVKFKGGGKTPNTYRLTGKVKNNRPSRDTIDTPRGVTRVV